MESKTKEDNMDSLLKEYVDGFNTKERIAYEIAKDHLGSSFNLEKSIGFQKWLKKKTKDNIS
jgi:hypothetical protein